MWNGWRNVETAEIIFYGLMAGLALAEVLLRYVFKVDRNNLVLEYVDSGMAAVLLAFVIRSFGVQAFKIPSGSMENTLLVGDHLLVNKFIYGTRLPGLDKNFLALRGPQRGDIVVFKYPEDPSRDFIKRCLGVPGDVVEVKAKQVYVNGSLQVEPYALHRDLAVLPGSSGNPRDFYGPVTVPAEAYFMLGDNRDYSKDSRFWGFLPRKLIRGKAWVVYWPVDRWQSVR